jgi:hypothetical protein
MGECVSGSEESHPDNSQVEFNECYWNLRKNLDRGTLGMDQWFYNRQIIFRVVLGVGNVWRYMCSSTY